MGTFQVMATSNISDSFFDIRFSGASNTTPLNNTVFIDVVENDLRVVTVEDVIPSQFNYFVAGQAFIPILKIHLFSNINSSDVSFVIRNVYNSLNEFHIGASKVSVFKESGKTCVQVFFFRSKQNWGNQAYFPKHDPDEKIEKILSSFIGQFYENKSVPRMILLNADVKDRLLLETAFSKREKKEITVKLAKTHDEKILSKLAEKNAKESLTQKILETESNSKLIDNISDKFLLKFNINLIEVYDNSHIQGSDSVGALIAFGKEGFLKIISLFIYLIYLMDA